MTAPDGFWSTDHARPDEALSYWIEAICEAFLEMKADARCDDFTAQLTKFQFGPIDINYVETDPQEVWRTRAAIARSRQNFFYLLYMCEGRMGISQCGREAVIGPGDCALVNSLEPYRFSLPIRNDCLSVQIPQQWLRGWLPHPEDATAIPLASHSAWGATLASAVGNLKAKDLNQIALPFGVVADQIGALMALALGDRREMLPRANASLLRRIIRSIEDRSCDPDTDPAAIAAEHGISKRYLHLVLSQGGTSFGAALIETRLKRAKALLDDARFGPMSIAEIGWRCGFSNASHFARRFRSRFGAAPNAYRRALHS